MQNEYRIAEQPAEAEREYEPAYRKHSSAEASVNEIYKRIGFQAIDEHKDNAPENYPAKKLFKDAYDFLFHIFPWEWISTEGKPWRRKKHRDTERSKEVRHSGWIMTGSQAEIIQHMVSKHTYAG